MNTTFQRIKNDSDVAFDVLRITDIERIDGSIRAITLSTPTGEIVKILQQNYSMEILIPKPPEMVKAYHVTGELHDGIKCDQVFSDKYDAENAVANNPSLTMEEIEVAKES